MSQKNQSARKGVTARACAQSLRVSLVAAAVAAVCTPAMAQDVQQPQTVVTAARTATPLDDTLADVRVITAEQIANTGGRSLAEVLQRFAGATIASNGGRGNSQSISIRGSSQVILLVDGVRFGSATTGDPSLQQIPLESIERIEVVHGPASALYGSDAIGGVIQIFTKQGQGVHTPWQPYANVTWGRAGYKDGQAGFSGAQSGWNYSLNMARVIDPGFSAKNDKQASSYHPDSDAFNQSSLSAALGYALHADWRLDASVLRASSVAAFDNASTKQSWVESDAGTLGLKLTGQLTPDWKSVWRVGYANDKQWTKHKTLSTGAMSSNVYQTTQQEYQWNNEIKTRWGMVAAGLEHAEQKVDSSTTYDVDHRDTDAVYVGLNGGWRAHTWQVNLRRDDNSQFGTFTTWGLGYGYDVLPGLRAYGSRSKSMKAPTFNQLYYPGYGSPELQPEEALSTELGMTAQWQGHHLRLAHFDTQLHNMIAGSPLQNLDQASKKGWSFGYRTSWQGWQLALNHEQLVVRDGDGVRYTVRTPAHQTSVSLDQRIGAWTWGGNVLHVGKRTDSIYGVGPVGLPRYTTLDLHAQYQVAPDWALQARLSNVTDRQYETAYAYNQAGRAAYLTLKWTPR